MSEELTRKELDYMITVFGSGHPLCMKLVALRDAKKPKDELYEKWLEITNGSEESEHILFNFNKFKNHFKKELSGTRGLDELLKWSEGFEKVDHIDIEREIKKIKSRLEGSDE